MSLGERRGVREARSGANRATKRNGRSGRGGSTIRHKPNQKDRENGWKNGPKYKKEKKVRYRIRSYYRNARARARGSRLALLSADYLPDESDSLQGRILVVTPALSALERSATIARIVRAIAIAIYSLERVNRKVYLRTGVEEEGEAGGKDEGGIGGGDGAEDSGELRYLLRQAP